MTANGRFVVMAIVLAASAGFADAQQVDFKATGSPLKAAPADREISAALRAVSAQKIHEDIQKLVSFRTRNTLSSMEADLPEGTGVTAAEEWLKSQYEAYSRECGGCLEVREDIFIQEPPRSWVPWRPAPHYEVHEAHVHLCDLEGHRPRAGEAHVPCYRPL
jgi:hypothetical protein